MVTEYESYFQHRWEKDKNSVISSLRDKRILKVLPLEVEKCIYQQFLFIRFMERYCRYFDLQASYQLRRKYLVTKMASLTGSAVFDGEPVEVDQ